MPACYLKFILSTAADYSPRTKPLPGQPLRQAAHYPALLPVATPFSPPLSLWKQSGLCIRGGQNPQHHRVVVALAGFIRMAGNATALSACGNRLRHAALTQQRGAQIAVCLPRCPDRCSELLIFFHRLFSLPLHHQDIRKISVAFHARPDQQQAEPVMRPPPRPDALVSRGYPPD